MGRRLEWWPDDDGAVLRDGAKVVALGELDLPPDLIGRIEPWKARYEDDRLPIDGPGDPDWLREGGDLLRQVRFAVGERFEVFVTEPWWGLPDEDFKQL